MAVTASDMKFYLSGGSDNSNPNQSLGGPISYAEISSGLMNNVFDDVSAVQSGSGHSDYRCVYLRNTHPTSSLIDAYIWVDSPTASPHDEIDIGLDPAGISGEAVEIADEEVSPPGVTFTHPTSYETAIPIGTLTPGQYIAVWFNRVVQAGAGAFPNNTFSIRIRGETA